MNFSPTSQPATVLAQGNARPTENRFRQRGRKMEGSVVREKIAKHGLRNSNVLATATISNIMGTTPCIEPNYKNLCVKSNLSGDFIVLNSELVKDLKKANLWNQEMLNQLQVFRR